MFNGKIIFIFVYFIFFKGRAPGPRVERVLDAPHVRVNLDTDFRNYATQKSFRSTVERVLDAPHVRVNLDTDFVRLTQLCNTEEVRSAVERMIGTPG